MMTLASPVVGQLAMRCKGRAPGNNRSRSRRCSPKRMGVRGGIGPERNRGGPVVQTSQGCLPPVAVVGFHTNELNPLRIHRFGKAPASQPRLWPW